MQYFADRSTAVIQRYPLSTLQISDDPYQAGDGILTITAQPSPDTV